MEGISWKRAYAGSLLVHLAVAGLLAVGLAGSVAQHEQEKMYVVDLDRFRKRPCRRRGRRRFSGITFPR